MRLVVDTNNILSALLNKGLSRKIINSQNIDFYTVDYALEEINKYRDYIVKKSGLTKEALDTMFSLFMENVVVVPYEKIKAKMKESMGIMENIDPKDAPILACALAIPNDGIWTQDKHFDKQNKVKVWSSKDLLEYI
jgi:predicted nucleic acid-binding protein